MWPNGIGVEIALPLAEQPRGQFLASKDVEAVPRAMEWRTLSSSSRLSTAIMTQDSCAQPRTKLMPRNMASGNLPKESKQA